MTLTWLLLDHLAWRFVFVLKSCSWLILVQVPSLYLLIWEFSPHPPSPSSHPCFIPFTRTHIIPSHLEQVFYERRNHLRFFRLGRTRVLHLKFCFGMDGSFEFHTQLSQWNHLHRVFTIWLKTRFSIWDSWKESVTVRILQHFGRRPRAKNPTHVLVREKKSALLACLWLSFLSKTHVAIVPLAFLLLPTYRAVCAV